MAVDSSSPGVAPPARREVSIWAFAFGYFAAYVPYSAATKAVSSGWLPGMTAPLDGVAVLPWSVLASVVGMAVFMAWTGWWRLALKPVGTNGLRLPLPTRTTFLSGLLTSAVVMTTTISYTFSGVSIVFVMLLMRGGVLILAPLVDRLSGRRTRWFSWVGLALSLAALIVANATNTDTRITLWCAIDVVIYLLSYFGRLRWMSRLAKSDDPDDSRRYFVEEQVVATPVLVVVLALVAWLGPSIAVAGIAEFASTVRSGFVDVVGSPAFLWVLFLGVCSQLTGVFGALILLDRRENTFCVPVNRSSSILAGVVATLLLAAVVEQAHLPAPGELVGAALLLIGVLVLSVAPLWEKHRARTTSSGSV